MNAKNIFVTLVLLIGLVFLSASVTQAQTTYYVNAVTGLDGYNGLSPTVGGPGVGPKQTINNAIAAASSGDIISVDYASGNVYNEAVVAGNGATTTPGSKKLTFTSTNGTPNVVSFQANNGLASPDNTITFTGPFKFNTGLTLSAGAVIGAGNITVGGTVTRTALSASNSGTVDAQLLYTGTVNFVYNGGFAMTTGLELAPAADASTIGAITTAAAGTIVTLSESKTMNGALTTADELKLNGGTLTINGANAHTIGAAVTNGTLNFVMNGAASVAGAFAVPVITASSTAAQTLTMAATSAGNVSASGAASITLTAATPVGNIDNSGTGTVTASAALTIGAITNSAAGTVTATLATTVGAVTNSAGGTVNLTAATTISSITNSGSGTVASAAVAAVAVNGNVLQSGTGSITFASTAGVTVTGTTTNSAAIVLPGGTTAISITDKGLITFAAGPHVFTGVVTCSPAVSGSTCSGNGGQTTVVTNNGQIRFTSTAQALTFTGGIVVSATSTIVNAGVSGTGTSTITGNGRIILINTTGNILAPGGITISTNWPLLTAVTGQGAITQNLNGSLNTSTITTGTYGTAANPIGPIVNTSSGANSTGSAQLNGDLTFGWSGATAFYGTTISTSGGSGGYIGLGNYDITLSGSITNSRTSALAEGHIWFGLAATAGVDIAIGGDITNTGASSIVINCYSGAGGENLSIAGNIVSSGTGVIDVALAPMTGGAITLGGINITSGTIDLSGLGAATSTITVNQTTNFAGGTLALTTSAARTLRLGGLTNNFSTVNTSTNFSSTTNVTLLVQATTIFGQQIINGNLAETRWYGPVNINNTNNNAIVPGVIIQGGNFRVLNNLTFAGSVVNVNDITVFIGSQALAKAGNFVNTNGYTSTGNGFVSMNGNAAQAVSGIGTFGNFEADAAGQTITVAAGTGKFTGTFNLTAGTVSCASAVDNATDITFDNSTTYPTIVKNAGLFAYIPTFTSMVNVYYIGVDQTSGKELPTNATKLNNLTVATTNGAASAGKGVVAIENLAPTVNGTINIFANQALLLKGTTILSMNGAAIQLDGDIVNDAGGATNALKFVRVAGTTVTGAGVLPDIIVDTKSVGNVITGSAGLATGLLGTDYIRGGVADLLPGNGGSITFNANAGTDVSSLSVAFAAANATTGVHLGIGGAGAYAVTSAQVNTATGGSLILGANLIQGTCLANNAGGSVDVGTFTYTVRGTTGNVVNTTSSTIGTGTLKYEMGAASTLAIAGGAATIGSNVLVTTLPTTSAFVLSLTTNNLTIAGNLELAGSATLDIAAGLTLTETGSAVTIGSSAVISGPGILRLNAATPPLTFTYSGAPTITNLTISNDVDLAGTGTALVVSTAFLHNGGTLSFGSRNLSITGTFTRTNDAVGYSATTGYLILRNAAINQASGFSIPNLRFGVNPDAINFAFAGTGVVTVTKRLYIDNATANTITHTVSSAAKLAVADSVDVYYSEGKFDVAPVYAAGINLHAVNTAGPRTIDATVWPATAALVRTLNVNNAGQVAVLPGARTVNNEILYTAGTLNLSAAAQVLTLVDGSNINVIAGVLSLAGGGSIVYGNTNNVAYKIDAAYNANLELPQTVNNLTITRNTNVANSAVTINHSVTVNGELAIKNDLTIPAAPPTIVVTANGDVSIINDSENFSNATDPNCAFTQSMVFGGGNTTLKVPALTPPLNIGNISISKTASTNTVTLDGGNIRAAFLTFVTGDIETGDNILYLPAPTQGAVAGGAISQGFAGAGPNSMVVGNVGKTLVNSGALATSTEPTSIFPVGTGMVYRPMTLTFNPNFGVPTTPNATIVVGHVNSTPGGSQALPIIDGIETGVPIARYPSFYWSVYTVGSVSPSSKFDLGLTGGDFTDFDSPANVRIIRRHGAVGDINNDWLLQGSNENYDNEVNTETGFTAINRESVAGLRTGGAVFTYGLKTNIVAATLDPITIEKVGTVYPPYKLALGTHVFTNFVGSLTYTITSTNSTIATAVVTNDTLVVTALKDGDATINIQAMDENNDFAIAVLLVNATSVDVEKFVPLSFGLAQNYPNPFNPTTNISFDVPQNSSVKIVIYDMLGREVTTLVNTNYAPGRYTVPFNASRLSSGMYIYRMTSQSASGEMFTSTKKLMLVK